MTSAAPPLSVIVPFYDEVAYVAMAVNSILSQGIDGVQVIVVNDNPAVYAPGFLETLLPASVHILHHDRNLGLSAARNSGIAAATGAQIGFLDSDDYYTADGLARQLALAQSSGACMTHASCAITRVGSPELTLLGRDAVLFPAPRTARGLIALEEAQFITSSWSSLYRADFLARANLTFDPAQTRFEDRLFVLQTTTAATSIAVLGSHNRVWRRRAGSISVTRPDAETFRLQVQLLEKCLAHVQAYSAKDRACAKVLKRESFNTLSRLIWDLGVVAALAQPDQSDPAILTLGPRVMALAAACTIGNEIFDDRTIVKISRVGKMTKLGTIRRVDVFDYAKALRAGDFAAAMAVITARQSATGTLRSPALLVTTPDRPRLVLHLGMHKTGSTALQKRMMTNRDALLQHGVLFPQSGLMADFEATRKDGFPGHLGLLQAHRDDADAPWQDLRREIARTNPAIVVISCENMLMPFAEDRATSIPALMAKFNGFARIDAVAFARRPDHWAERLYRELATNGSRMTARDLPEFLVDFAGLLTDFPALLGPFEQATGSPVTLIDHDTSARQNAHWQNFVAAADLPLALLDLGAAGDGDRIYASPSREEIEAARILNTMTGDGPLRIAALRGFFAGGPPEPTARQADMPMLHPDTRAALLARFAATSGDFAAARGYHPDVAALTAAIHGENWSPLHSLPIALVTRLHQARLQAEPRAVAKSPTEPALPQVVPMRHLGDGITIRLRPRPWLRKLIFRFLG